ncbi:MAS20-domain-containing protein [Epithele typhae]|uniref:MAS20-domain-containing protein n=1 Tax=Epithele typhae TaxID=378194 RepID=UPI0020075131|nr:MAS20-domain-containing protein [Epithele typhae]KAH9927200.1 MAS20-domain-containing protein [Epithele typhae]
MSSASRPSTALTITAVTVLGGLVAYAVWFDHRRRNDKDFRKKLRKDKKKVTKQTQQDQSASASVSGLGSINVSPEDIKAQMVKIGSEEPPATPQQKEVYFMAQIEAGDQFVARGPLFFVDAAACFYRAFRVYPSPVEFIMMLQNQLPQPIFELFMQFVNADVSISHSENEHEEHAEDVETSPTRSGPPSETSSQEWDQLTDPGSYYEFFPGKAMNVAIESASSEEDKPPKKILVAKKDFNAGDVIYTETPMISALDADLEGKHCAHCFKPVDEASLASPSMDTYNVAFCSQTCRAKAHRQWYNFLHGSDPILPPSLRKARTAYATWLNGADDKPPVKRAHVLAGRFLAKQVALETGKLLPGGAADLEAELHRIADGKDRYGVGDHMERLRFLEGSVTDQEVDVLKNVLASALPGFENAMETGRHAMLIGKLSYNAIGITPDGGRDDKPAPTERPEDQERTRTPHGTSRQLGAGLYLVSSYLAHSCDPSTRPVFAPGSTDLKLVATRPIKAGDELTIAWVDVQRPAEESAELARRMRRIELARGWRFKCECSRCLTETLAELAVEDDAAEGATAAVAEEDLGITGDESVTENVTRHEGRTAGEPTGLSMMGGPEMGPD